MLISFSSSLHRNRNSFTYSRSLHHPSIDPAKLRWTLDLSTIISSAY
jgi:hypothetical protein